MTAAKVVYENDYFQVRPGEACSIPGYLIVFAKQQATSIDQLTPAAQAALGETLALVHKTLQQTLKPERIYTVSLGEVLPLLHFHIFPRTSDILQAYRRENKLSEQAPVNGALLFDWARGYYQNHADPRYHKVMRVIIQCLQDECYINKK